MPKNNAKRVAKSCETVRSITPIKKVIINNFCQALARAEFRFFSSQIENTMVDTTSMTLINIIPHLKNRSLSMFTLFHKD